MKFSFPPVIPDDLKGLQEYLKLIIREVQRFSDRNVDLRQNCKVAFVSTTMGAADTEVTINHNLGVIPFMYIANGDKGGSFYDSRNSDWSESQIFVKHTATTISARFLILG